ncbi:MAG: hypothetical protein R3C60_09705 [Parvularculaceae bacterium]
MRIVAGLIVFIALSLAATATEAARSASNALGEIDFFNLYVEVDSSDRNFTVIDSRYEETGTGAALFGIAGALATSAAAAGSDNKKAEPLREAAEAIPLEALISDAVKSKITSKGEIEIADSEDAATHRLIINIHNYGLLRRAKDDPRLRAFLNLSWEVVDNKGRILFEKKRENTSAPDAYTLDEFTPDTLQSEFEVIAPKAGEFIGSQINYR